MSVVTKFRARTIMAAIITMAALHAAIAAPLPNRDRPVTYTVVDQDLRDVVTEVVQQSGLRANMSEAVHGRVRGQLPPAPLAEFLDHLAATYGLDWYYDGSTIYVSTISETVSKMLPLGPVGMPQLAGDLDALAISDSRWPLRGPSGARVVIVDGPPRYVHLVEQTLDALSQQRIQSAGKVNVFRGSVAQ